MPLSFDGFAAGPNGEMNWIQHDGEVFDHVSKFIALADTDIYGPVTFQMMESFWPGILKNPEFDQMEMRHAKWYEGARSYC